MMLMVVSVIHHHLVIITHKGFNMTEEERHEIVFHSWGETKYHTLAIYKYKGFDGYKLIQVSHESPYTGIRDMFMCSNIPYDKDIIKTWKELQ